MTTPDELSNLELWYKADAIAGLNDGDSVSSWADSSGNSRSATQSDSSRYPLYKTNRINSLPAVNFDASNDGLTTGYTVSNPFTAFAVYGPRSSATARRAIQGSNNWLIGPYNSNHQLYNGGFISGPAISDGVFVMAVTTQQSPGGAVFRVNGSQIGTNGSTTAPGTLVMAAHQSGSYGEPLGGDIAEVVVYSRVLDSSEIDAIELYLANKYAIPLPPLIVTPNPATAVTSRANPTVQGGSATQTFQPDGTVGIDTIIRSWNPTGNYGDHTTGDGLLGRYDADNIGRMLIKFSDLSEIPDNATITSAELTLTTYFDYSDNDSTYYIYRLKRAWAEMEATWNVYSTGNNWQTAGGFGSDDCEQTEIGSGPVGSNVGEPGTFTLTLDTPTTKADLDLGYGWLIKSPEAVRDAYSIQQSDVSTASYRPKLVVVWSLPSEPLIIVPDPATAVASRVNPTVYLTPVVVSPDPATATAGNADGSYIPLVVAPAPASARATAPDPTYAVGLDIEAITGSDDAHQQANGGGFKTSLKRLELVSSNNTKTRSHVGIRFQGVQVPAGSTILSAKLNLSNDGTQDDARCTIYCQAHDNPPTFSSASTVVTRDKTTASAVHQQDNLTSGYDLSPDFSTPVQEVIDRPGWAQGNALAVILWAANDAVKRYYIDSYESGASTRPHLVLLYAPPDPSEVSLTPNGAECVARTGGPVVVISNDIVVEPGVIGVIAEAAGPTVVQSSAVITPDPAVAVAATWGPEVAWRLTYTPEPAVAVSDTTGPEVVIGTEGVTWTPEPAVAIGETRGPIIDDVVLIPDPASAIAEAPDPGVMAPLVIEADPAWCVSESGWEPLRVSPDAIETVAQTNMPGIGLTPVPAWAVTAVAGPVGLPEPVGSGAYHAALMRERERRRRDDDLVLALFALARSRRR